MSKLITILDVDQNDLPLERVYCEFGESPHGIPSSIVFYLSSDNVTDLRAYACCTLHLMQAMHESAYYYVSNKYLYKFVTNFKKKNCLDIRRFTNRLAYDNFHYLNK